MPELTDAYIKRLLGLGKHNVPQELIEFKRATLQLKRRRIQQNQDDLEEYLRDKFINDNIVCKT